MREPQTETQRFAAMSVLDHLVTALLDLDSGLKHAARDHIRAAAIKYINASLEAAE